MTPSDGGTALETPAGADEGGSMMWGERSLREHVSTTKLGPLNSIVIPDPPSPGGLAVWRIEAEGKIPDDYSWHGS